MMGQIRNEPSHLHSITFTFAVVALGVSAPAFNRILERPSWVFLPADPVAFLAVWMIVVVPPFVLVLLLETLFSRRFHPGPLRLWRTAGLVISLTLALAPGTRYLLGEVALIVLPLGVALVVLLFYRLVHEWAAYFGIILMAYFLVQAGFFTSFARLGERPAIPSDNLRLAGPVLILLFDELSYDALLKDGQIDAALFPNFAALAANGIEFTNATSHHAFTWYSIPSMLSAKTLLPDWDRATIHQHNVLSDLALRTPVRAYEDVLTDCLMANAVCHHSFQGRPLQYALGHSVFWGNIAPQWFVPAGQVLWGNGFDGYLYADFHQTVLRDLAGDDAQRTLFFYHALLPHYPFLRDADGRVSQFQHVSFQIDGDFNAVWANYRNTVRFVDKRLGEIIARLKDLGLYEQATIAVTSDHGIRPGVDQGPSLIGDLSPLTPRVPLIIKAPGVAPGRTDVVYQHRDFIPTLFGILGVDFSNLGDGVSAFAPDRPAVERVFYYGKPVSENRFVLDETSGQWQRTRD